MLEGRFGIKGPSWEELWEREPRFRRIWRVSSAMWAAATLLDAVVRVVMAYTLPIPAVPALQTGLMIVTMLLMQVVTHVYYVRAGLWTLVRGGKPGNAAR